MLAHTTLRQEALAAPGGPIVRQAIAEAKARASKITPNQLWDMMSPEVRARLLYGSRFGAFPRETAASR